MRTKPLVCSLCLVLVCIGIAFPAADKKADRVADPALAQFIENTKDYVDLRSKIEKDLPPLRDKEDADAIRAHQQTLRLKLAAARRNASRGSMLTPHGAKALKQIINSEMQGPGGKTARTTVLESSPKPIPCTINSAYPSAEPVSTVPPDLLMKLPELPDNLEYRFVQHDLIIRDAKANMIVDCLPNALAPPTQDKTKGVSTKNETGKKTE